MGEEKIEGKIIYRLRDDYGQVTVAEDGDVRSLYFGDGILQSSICLARPDMLVEDYTRAMMSALLFMNDPGSILMIGLGGCSLVNFISKAFPLCTMDVVEIRQTVIELAQTFFLPTGDNPQLKIFHADGRDFVCRRDDCEKYDLIFVDAFDEGGPAARLLKKEFFEACLRNLSGNGILVMNVWNSPNDNFPVVYAGISEVFGGAALKLPLGEVYQNVIIFGFADQRINLSLPEYRLKAGELQRKYRISFQKFLRYLYWQNSGGQ